jgi:hypothetical protein
MRRELHIEKLSDEFGQYMLTLICKCGGKRECEAITERKGLYPP